MERITRQLLKAAEAHFTRRIAAVRQAISAAPDAIAAAQALLGLAARWTPDALATMLREAMEVAALEGRDTALAGMDGTRFATAVFEAAPFREQIDFLRQKRVKPTRAWTDALYGDHDRAFVIAGATDTAMLEEFQAAVIAAAETYDRQAFAAEFDRIVAKYGWDYRGGRTWRINTIFETNIRTSYMAGRLRQMRDPDVIKRRPYWQYLHADTRIPVNPRPEHVAWDGLVLRHDDPWWDMHFPPNDWRCSCGVTTLSERDLRQMGKSGPDKAPETVMTTVQDPATGQLVPYPEGIGYGWAYQPGDLWERGLVPSALIEEGGGLVHEGRHAVQIDTPVPLADLIAAARPFVAPPMDDGLPEEDYVRAFLAPFGADIGRAVLWEDVTGTRIPISELFFRNRRGDWKVAKRGRARFVRLMAEVLLDPDEIWLGVTSKPDPADRDVAELLIDRRYVRVDPERGIIVVLQIGRRWWEEVTIYTPTRQNGKPDMGALDRRRGGKLLWKRK